jgi:hypothetical protein
MQNENSFILQSKNFFVTVPQYDPITPERTLKQFAELIKEEIETLLSR